MTKSSLLIVSASLIGISSLFYFKNKTDLSKLEMNSQVVEPTFPKKDNFLLAAVNNSKFETVKTKLILEAANTVTLRGPVTNESVSSLIKQIQKVSRTLAKSDKIYLVLDTPGGSIFDGLELIDYLEAIPQEVKTVTLFAASMGFQIVENNPGERLIARNGTLMSHRASGGVSGQFNGELETRYRMIKRKIDVLDLVASKRLNLSFDDYQKKIKDEYWIHGFDSVEEKAADQMVLIDCGKSLEGKTETIKIPTFFGPVTAVFDACPLIKEPISVDMTGINANAKAYMTTILDTLFFDKSKFVSNIIVTNKFYQIFK